MNVYQFWIIPNGQLTASLAKTNSAPGLPGLNGMFTVPLRNIGGGTATHAASAGYMSQAEVDYLTANLSGTFLVYQVTAAQLAQGTIPERPQATLLRLGYEMVPGP